MSDIVRDFIAAELEAIEEVNPQPIAPFGYGSDISCTTDMTADAADVDGNSTLALGEAIVRRLITPRGSLPDDANYGIDIRGMLNTGTDVAKLRELGSTIRAELTKDDRISDLTVQLTPSPNGSSMRIAIRIVPADPATETFSLTLAATDAELLIQEINA